MARTRRASALLSWSDARRGLIILSGTGVAAAGLSITRRLLRRRSDEVRRRYRIDPGQDTGRELRRIASGQLDLALAELEKEPGQCRHIEEARQALERSRALLQVGRDLLDPDVYQQEKRNLGQAERLLSDTRQRHALLETAEGLAANGALTEESQRRLRDSLEKPAQVPQEEDQAEAMSAVAETAARATEWSLPEGQGLDVLAPGIKRVYGQGRRALARARKKSTDKRWRELGQRSRDLGHAAALVHNARPERISKLAQRARRLSDLLEEDHELAVLAQRLSEVGLPQKDAKALIRLIRRRRSKLQGEADRVADRLYRRKPGAFLRRLGLS